LSDQQDAERQMSKTNAQGFKYATQMIPQKVNSEDIIAYSQKPPRSNIGQTSEYPDDGKPVDQRILDQNNLVRADTAITGKRNYKNNLQAELSKDNEYCAISQPDVAYARESSLQDVMQSAPNN